MTTWRFRFWFWSILLAGLAVRLFSTPPFAFCCDVPTQVQVIEARTFLIQFPGYAPFQLLVAAIAGFGIPVFKAMWLFSLACTTMASIYVIPAARRAAGEGFALLAAVVMSFGISCRSISRS
jgi:hypothetical protein